MNLEITRDFQHDKWDDFVHKSPACGFYHLYGWRRVMENTYGHETFYIMARDGEAIRGILPLFEVRWPGGKKHIYSMPGGLVADGERVFDCLFAEAGRIAKGRKARSLVIRDGLQRWPAANEIENKKAYYTCYLPLERDTDKMWKRFNDKARNQVRKARRSGLSVSSHEEGVEIFYRLYARHMRDLGTPAIPLRFFKNMHETFCRDMKILFVKHNNRIIGGMLLCLLKDLASDPFAVSLKEYRALCPNNILYWEAISFACRQGKKYFDMGRSQPASGTFHFKKQWNPEIRRLYNYGKTLISEKKSSPFADSARDNAWFTKIWKILPVGIATGTGRFIRRYVPFG